MPKSDGLDSGKVIDRFTEFAGKIASGELQLPASLERDEQRCGAASGWDDDFSDFFDFDNNR
jgi:hypothetical protein